LIVAETQNSGFPAFRDSGIYEKRPLNQFSAACQHWPLGTAPRIVLLSAS